MNSIYLESATRIFKLYKMQGEKAMAQMEDATLHWSANEDSNSVVVIVKHLWGNMLSRWTDFLTSDGEKPWRQRDAEFEPEVLDRVALMKLWEEGWDCVFKTLESLKEEDLQTIIYIRNEGQSVMDAINRQIAHYSSHIGQIIYIAKLQSHGEWKSLTIPRNQSAAFNKAMFDAPKENRPFTDRLMEGKQ
jgi:hypothetical protein